MKTFRMVFAWLTIFLFVSICWTQTKDEIINQYLEVTGRKDDLKGVNTIFIKRSVYNSDKGTTNYHTSYHKRPNRSRYERNTSNEQITILAYDGKKAWRGSLDTTTNSNTNVKDIPQDSPLFKGANFDNNFDGKFIDYAKKGIPAEFLGKETIDYKEMYRLKMVWEDGQIVEYYFDVSTGLIWKHYFLFKSSVFKNR